MQIFNLFNCLNLLTQPHSVLSEIISGVPINITLISLLFGHIFITSCVERTGVFPLGGKLIRSFYHFPTRSHLHISSYNLSLQKWEWGKRFTFTRSQMWRWRWTKPIQSISQFPLIRISTILSKWQHCNLLSLKNLVRTSDPHQTNGNVISSIWIFRN